MAGPTPGWQDSTCGAQDTAISDNTWPTSNMPAMAPTPLLEPPSSARVFTEENQDSRV